MTTRLPSTAPLILIIEDEVDIAEILDAYFQREGFRTLHCDNGQWGLQMLRQRRPDLVMLDIRMPGQNGIDVLQAIRAEGRTPVIMLTALTDDVNKLLSLRLGADDYISKPFNPAEVVARVHAVLRRSLAPSEAPEERLHLGKLVVDQGSHSAFVMDDDGTATQLPLTLTEFRLLAFLMRKPRRCMTRLELIEGCLPESDALDRVIDSHLSKLRRKLSDAGCGQLIETVRGVGYRLWPDR
ncbi:response regulator [Mangrovitalea sediminis]|uniref:response regulator n=1 Tax=Mangrovitalea sediminis TaxID=1982043 RepID=UPI000BE555AC|nr:response regulator [Mangrovitalea sediminis]